MSIYGILRLFYLEYLVIEFLENQVLRLPIAHPLVVLLILSVLFLIKEVLAAKFLLLLRLVIKLVDVAVSKLFIVISDKLTQIIVADMLVDLENPPSIRLLLKPSSGTM